MGDEYAEGQDFFHYNPFTDFVFKNEPLWAWMAFLAAMLLFLKAWGNIMAHID